MKLVLHNNPDGTAEYVLLDLQGVIDVPSEFAGVEFGDMQVSDGKAILVIGKMKLEGKEEKGVLPD